MSRAMFCFALWAVGMLHAAEPAALLRFELHDGRTLQGRKVAEDDAKLTVLIQAGEATAELDLDKSAIKAVTPAEPQEPAGNAPAENRKPVVDTTPSKQPAAAPEAAPVAKNEQDFARVRGLLFDALRQQAQDRAEEDGNPIPYDSDPTYFDLYGPLMDEDEVYLGLVLREGVLPRVRRYNTRWYQHFVLSGPPVNPVFTSPNLPGTFIFPSGAAYQPFNPLPVPQGASFPFVPQPPVIVP